MNFFMYRCAEYKECLKRKGVYCESPSNEGLRDRTLACLFVPTREEGEENFEVCPSDFEGRERRWYERLQKMIGVSFSEAVDIHTEMYGILGGVRAGREKEEALFTFVESERFEKFGEKEKQIVRGILERIIGGEGLPEI